MSDESRSQSSSQPKPQRKRPQHANHNHGAKRSNNRRPNNKRPRSNGNGSKPIIYLAEDQLQGEATPISGVLFINSKGCGLLRLAENNFGEQPKDPVIPPDLVKKHGLRPGFYIQVLAKKAPQSMQAISIESINGQSNLDTDNLPIFEELRAINPNKKFTFETTSDKYSTRVLDIVAPVGKGQRGLIVAPPRSGKTSLLLDLASAIETNYSDECALLILLVDERPEEVTEFRRQFPNAEIYASSNDDSSQKHAQVAELCIERGKRLVEQGKDAIILMDSITRLARAYNQMLSSGGNKPQGNRGNNGRGGGRGIQTGGIMVGALETPRRLFAAARNTEEAGSLTILATALVQTNSRADEAIFQEFKGTGNMELVLDRQIAEQYIFPAVDILKSGTRREELLLAEIHCDKISRIRKGLSGNRNPAAALEKFLFFIKRFPSNNQMLLEIKS